MWYVEKMPTAFPDEKCYMVAHILGRIPKDVNTEVKIKETEQSSDSDNGLQQAYTCVMLDAKLEDYRASLSSTTSEKVVKVELDGTQASSIDAIRISWYSNRDGVQYAYSNYDYNMSTSGSTGRVVFKPLNANGVSTPPTIAVKMIQTASSFSLNDFDKTVDGRTNRGTLYLVPFGNIICGQNERAKWGCQPNSTVQVKSILEQALNATNWAEPATFVYYRNNNIPSDAFVKSNDKVSVNKPYLVYCEGDTSTEFACSAVIHLPKPVGGERNKDTFMFTVSIPYEQPDTDFSMEFICRDGVNCPNTSIVDFDNTEHEERTANLNSVQVEIDSTGRANDLFRRVKTRLETTDTSFAYAFYAMQLFGSTSGSDGSVIQKDLKGVITEWCAGTNRTECKEG